jgi:hypothetical protein
MYTDRQSEAPRFKHGAEGHHLLTNMQFLLSLQTAPFPWFKREDLEGDPKATKSKFAHNLSRMGRLIQNATLDRIAARGHADGDGQNTDGVNDLEEAVAMTRGLLWIKEYPYLETLLLQRARSFMEASRYEAGILLLEQCVQEAPTHHLFQLELARMWIRKGEPEGATELMESLIRKNRRDRAIAAAYGVWKAWMGEYVAAKLVFARIASDPEPDPELDPWISAAQDFLLGEAPDPEVLKTLPDSPRVPSLLRDCVLEGERAFENE